MEFRRGVVPVLARIGIEVRGIFVDFPQAVVLARLSVSAERQVPGPGVRQEILGWIQHPACFEQDDIQAEVYQGVGGGCAAGARSDDDYVVFFFRHKEAFRSRPELSSAHGRRFVCQKSTFKPNCRMRGSPSVPVMVPKPRTPTLLFGTPSCG